MFASAKISAPGTAYYDKFTSNYQAGYNKIAEAVKIDERLKQNGGTLQQKLEAAELYKSGRTFFKEANQFNMMDIPEDKRAEVHDLREKMKSYDKCAQDRICAICNELDPKAKNSAVVPARPRSVNQTGEKVPGSTSTMKPKTAENKPHSCSRGDRCGAHHAPEVRKVVVPTPLQKVDTNKKINTVNKNKAMPRTTTRQQQIQQLQQLAANRAALLKGVDKVIGERLLDEVLDNTGVKLDDVAGCNSAKSALEEAVILPSLNPSLFSGLRQPVKGILLFGPPGNGKTLLAKAVAGDANQMFFNISASSLTSKWVGDSEKTIRSLFQIARNAQPSIIFIDEIDSILCERSEKDAEVSRRMKTEFLVQFDGATSSPDDRILVIGATNRPYELDDAVLRRFPKRILLGLPDDSARKELIHKTLLKHNMLDGMYDSDLRYIAQKTRGFSNSDLVALCKEAAMVPIRSIDKSKLAKTDTSKLRNIRSSDFDAALQTIRPSTSEKIMTKLTEFSKNFGC